jgi:hypothetical protein
VRGRFVLIQTGDGADIVTINDPFSRPSLERHDQLPTDANIRSSAASIRSQLPPPTELRWSGDMKHVFVQRRLNNLNKAYVLPLAPGHLVPESIAHGLPSEQEMLKLPGARVIPSSDVAPGPTADIYAFTRETVQRNLYRVPVP